jgi:hypothetical protein
MAVASIIMASPRHKAQTNCVENRCPEMTWKSQRVLSDVCARYHVFGVHRPFSGRLSFLQDSENYRPLRIDC